MDQPRTTLPKLVLFLHLHIKRAELSAIRDDHLMCPQCYQGARALARSRDEEPEFVVFGLEMPSEPVGYVRVASIRYKDKQHPILFTAAAGLRLGAPETALVHVKSCRVLCVTQCF